VAVHLDKSATAMTDFKLRMNADQQTKALMTSVDTTQLALSTFLVCV